MYSTEGAAGGGEDDGVRWPARRVGCGLSKLLEERRSFRRRFADAAVPVELLRPSGSSSKCCLFGAFSVLRAGVLDRLDVVVDVFDNHGNDRGIVLLDSWCLVYSNQITLKGI